MPRSEPYERLGARRLALPDLVAQSVGFTGPAFSAAFGIPLVAGVISASGRGGGVAAPLSVLIAAVGVLAIGRVIAAYARTVHAAGSLYDYVSRGLGARVGTAAGWLYYSGITILLAGLLLLMGGYLQTTIQADFDARPLPAWAWTLLLLALAAAAVYLGARISARSQLALALVSMLVVGAFLVTVIARPGSVTSLRPFSPAAAAGGWTGIFFGAFYGVLLFAGFETAANLAEETPHPRHHVPAAVLTAAGFVAVFLLLAGYAEVTGFRDQLKALTAAAGRPLFALGAPGRSGGFGGLWTDRALELVVLLDMIAMAVGCAVAASRGWFAMARDRRVPAPLAIVSRRHGTPLGALALLVAASGAGLLVSQFWTGLFALPQTPHDLALFVWGATYGSFALIAAYLLTCAGAVRSVATARHFGTVRHRVEVLIAALAGLAITGGAVYAAFDQVPKPMIDAPWVGLAVLAIGFASTFVLRARQPASTRLADPAPGSRP
jgi:amino acid transporter